MLFACHHCFKKPLSLLLSLILVTASYSLFAADNEIISAKKLSDDIHFLASDHLKGRAAGSKESKLAALYIANRFKALGLSTFQNSTSYLQPFNTYKITQKSSKFITTMLVGNNISLVIYSYYMGSILLKIFPLEGYNEFTLLVLQTIVSTIIILITAEFLPKAIFRIYANEVLKIFAVPAYVFYYVFHFFSEFITLISDFFLRVFFKTKSDEQQTEFSKEELGNYINEQLETGNDEEVDSEIQIFQNALIFQNVKAREVMVPRTEMVAVEIHETVPNLKKLFIETGLSKILVYKTSLDDVLGYVNAFELFKKPKTIKSILLPLEIVPESMMINDILNTLMKKRKSVAIVVDEYGGTSGMITVEDIVEELFGEIEDEHDSQEFLERKISEKKFNFSARLEVDYLNETYNLNLEENEAYETLGEKSEDCCFN